MTETGSMGTLWQWGGSHCSAWLLYAVAVGWLTLQRTAPLCQAGLLASSSGSCRLTEDKGLWSYLGIVPTHEDTDGLG